MDKSTEQMTQYLRDNILNAGYDGEKFIQYMSEKKENGEDIEVWTFPELVKAVEYFIKLNPMKSSENKENEVTKNDSSDSFNFEKIETMDKNEKVDKVDKIDKVGIEAKRSSQDLIEIQPKVTTRNLDQVSNSNLISSVELSEIKIIKGGFLTSDSLIYKLNTIPQNWKVERKFKHFEMLRTLFLKMYPGYQIAPLRVKNKNSTEPNKMVKSHEIVQKFMDEIVSHPILRTCSELITFLSFNPVKDFTRKMNEFNSMKPLTEVTETKNPEGVAILEFDPEKENFCKILDESNSRILSIFDSLKKIYKGIAFECKKLDELYTNAADMYNLLGKEFQNVENFHNFPNFNHFNNIKDIKDIKEIKEIKDMKYMKDLGNIPNINSIRNDNLSRLSESISSSYKVVADSFKQTCSLIMSNIVTFYGNFGRETETLSELSKKWKNQKEIYYDSLKKLSDRKMAVLQMPPEKWDIPKNCEYKLSEIISNKRIAFPIILPQETSLVRKAKEMYGYLTNKNIEEANRVWNKNYENMNQFCMNYYKGASILSKTIWNLWDDFVKQISSSPKESKEIQQSKLEELELAIKKQD